MTVRDVLQAVIRLRGITAIKAAAAVGWTPQKFNRKKNEDTIRFAELCEILEAQDVDIPPINCIIIIYHFG